MKRRLPTLQAHLRDNFIEPAVYAPSWFNRMFADVQFDLMLRLWDVFMNEGPKIFYRAGLAVMKFLEGKNAKYD